MIQSGGCTDSGASSNTGTGDVRTMGVAGLGLTGNWVVVPMGI